MFRVVREYNLPDSFSSVLQRAMEGAVGNSNSKIILNCQNLDFVRLLGIEQILTIQFCHSR